MHPRNRDEARRAVEHVRSRLLDVDRRSLTDADLFTLTGALQFLLVQPEPPEEPGPPLAGDHVDGRDLLEVVRGGRKYLPTLADLIDRLSIVQLKEIFIPEHAAEYTAERKLIEHDIDLLLGEVDRRPLNAVDVRMIMMIMLSNRYIWENETLARAGGQDQDKLLKLTHSINGVRNAAKNVLAKASGERLDYKVDCFAEDLVTQFGNWNVLDK